MSFQLTDKVVYIISPETWGKMRVSKHHYALELAKRGNRVYFIEPPRLDNVGVKVRQSADHPTLFLVSYKPVFRGRRLLPATLFRTLLKWQVRLLKKKIGSNPDFVLCFHPFFFENLKWFGARYSVYFAVDQFVQDLLPPELYSADFSLAVSDSIYNRLNVSGKKVYMIQHGLNHFFSSRANNLLSELDTGKGSVPNSPLQVGYAGNLLMGGIDRNTMQKVIESNPGVKFIFWGQYDLKGGNFVVDLNDEITGFVDFLLSARNVELRGVLSPEELSCQMQRVDFFWACMKIGAGKIWDGSNSHKLLEYLSTGKPVVTHYVSSYKDSPYLDMLSHQDNEEYPVLFNKIVEKMSNGGVSAEECRNRIQFALSNTYEKQIERIETWINEG